jgi:hypothetical protein
MINLQADGEVDPTMISERLLLPAVGVFCPGAASRVGALL